MRRALRRGGYGIGAGNWDQGPGGTVCPIRAAAMIAGVWRDGHCADGGPEWGTENEPSETVMEFAVCFDLAAEQFGLGEAVSAVRIALGEQPEGLAWRDAA
jgi:hypothetical protein